MNLITHPTNHTPYEAMFANGTGYNITVVKINEGDTLWRHSFRPQPANVKFIEVKNINWRDYDCCIVHNERGYAFFKDCPLPMIWKEHTMRLRFTPNDEWLSRIDAYCFNHREAADRWIIPFDKKWIIEHWVDANDFCAHRRKNDKVLVVGNFIWMRHNKGVMLVKQLAKNFKFLLLGTGNEDLRNEVEIAEAPSFEEYLQCCRDCAVVLNPAPLLTMATLELLTMGVPMVTMDPYNLTDLLEHERTAWIAQSVGDAEIHVRLAMDRLAESINVGLNARAACMERFSKERFCYGWERLIGKVVGK